MFETVWFVGPEYNGPYLRRIKKERPESEEVLEAMDKFMDLDKKVNRDVRITFANYRFFGEKLPSQPILNLWLAYGFESIPDLQYKDLVYLPTLRIETRILFQYKYEKNRPQRCRTGAVMINWESDTTFIASMKECVDKLAERKKEYIERKRKKYGAKYKKKTDKEDREESSEEEKDTIESAKSGDEWQREGDGDGDGDDEDEAMVSKTRKYPKRKVTKRKRRRLSVNLTGDEDESDEDLGEPATKKRSTFIPVDIRDLLSGDGSSDDEVLYNLYCFIIVRQYLYMSGLSDHV